MSRIRELKELLEQSKARGRRIKLPLRRGVRIGRYHEGVLSRGDDFELPVIDPKFDDIDKKSKHFTPLLPVNDSEKR